jgi:hypothetical protein
LHLAATIERAEKQIILAGHARRLLKLLDDTPVVPGDQKQQYENAEEAREILNDAEAELRAWESTVEPVPTVGESGVNLEPKSGTEPLEAAGQNVTIPASEDGTATTGESEAAPSTERGEDTRRVNLTGEGAAAATEVKPPHESSGNDTPGAEQTQ